MKIPEKDFKTIVYEALEFRIRWRMTKQLMSHSQERVDCMNYFAASFFSTVITSMYHSITASAAKLLDTTANVISLPKLLLQLKKDARTKEETRQISEIDDTFRELKTIAKPLIGTRHEVVAHLSRVETPTRVLVKDIDSFEKQLDTLITQIATLGNFTQGGFGTTWEDWYEREVNRYGDAEKLMQFLEATSVWTGELDTIRKRESLRRPTT